MRKPALKKLVFPVSERRKCQHCPVSGERVRQSGGRVSTTSSATASWRQSSLPVHRTDDQWSALQITTFVRRVLTPPPGSSMVVTSQVFFVCVTYKRAQQLLVLALVSWRGQASVTAEHRGQSHTGPQRGLRASHYTPPLRARQSCGRDQHV